MKRAALVAFLALGFVSVAGSRAGAGPAAAAPTFTKDIAPILYNSCVSCHRAGEVAPMSLMSYEEVRPWAKSVRLKVANREMPPWGADSRYGKFKDDRSLTPEQVDTIVHWVDAGAPKGNDADLPPAPTFASGWSRGEPDVVIEMPIEFEIPAEGQVPVIDFFTRAPFTQDVYIKVSPFYHVDKIDEPLMLIHGEQDANPGTTPIQSEKMFEAMRGTGGKVKLVMLPFESHHYASMESTEHVLAEMLEWFDKYVKNAKPRVKK